MPTYRITAPDGKTYRVTGPTGSTKEQALAKVQAQLAAAPMAVEPASISAADIGRDALQGMTFGFGDEMRAGASAGLGALTGQGSFSDLYDVTRGYERGQQEQFAQNHPVASAASQIGGGLLTGVLGGMKAGGTAAGKTLAARVGNAGLLGRLGISGATGAAAGGGAGALTGAGNADEMSDIPIDALTGGAVGAVTGGLLGAATEGVRTGVRAGVGAYKRVRDPNHQAARNIEKVIKRSGLTEDEILQRAEIMGPNATIADTSDPAKKMLESVTNQPGAANRVALDQLTERSRKQGSELLSDLGPGRKFETLDALQNHRKQVASPLYEKAFNEGVPHTDNLEKVFKDIEEFAPGMWAKAKKLGSLSLANRGEKLPDDALGDARPSLRGWQYLKEKLDDASDSMARSGGNKAAGAVKDVRKRLLNELDKLNPDYGKARGEWAGTKQFEDMMQNASKFMTAPAAEFEYAIKGLSKVDREAVKIGAIQAIEDKLERGSWTSDATRLFRTPAMAKKMKALFNDPKEYSQFMNKLTVLAKQQETFDAVRGNSATAQRLAGQADSNDWIDSAVSSMVDLARSPIGAAQQGLLAIGRQASKWQPGMSEAARLATAKALLETDPAERALGLLANRGLLGASLPPARLPLLPGGMGLLSGQLAAMSATK